jgi:plasmid stabilization system protein ParE
VRIVFRRKAAEDLRKIRAYYLAIDVDALINILADIERSFKLIRKHPEAGPRVPGRRFRKITTQGYGYTIAYQPVGGAIRVIGIFWYQDRRSWSADALPILNLRSNHFRVARTPLRRRAAKESGMRGIATAIVGLVLPVLLLSGCGSAENPADQAAGPDFTSSSATRGVAFSFNYEFTLPPKAISKVQRQHVAACEQLGASRCRITGVAFDQRSGDAAEAALDLLLATTDAYRFASQGVDAVEAAKGEIASAVVQGSDAATGIAEAKQGETDTYGEINRIEAQLKDRKLPSVERSRLISRLEQLRQTLSEQAKSKRDGEQSLAVTPVHFGYDSEGVLAGENRFVRAAYQSWNGLQTMLVMVLVVLGYVLPWALLAAAVTYGIRFGRKRGWWDSARTPAE